MGKGQGGARGSRSAQTGGRVTRPEVPTQGAATYTLQYLTPQSTTGTVGEVQDEIRAVFGETTRMTPQALAALTGAPAGSVIALRPTAYGDGVILEVTHPNIKSMERMIRRDDAGSLYIKNMIFQARDSAPAGFGTRVFAAQVAAARRAGVKYLSTDPAGSPTDPDWNGFYTWPRLGYEVRISTSTRANAKAAGFGDVKTTHDLFVQPGGAAWWRDHGHDAVNAKFDLNPKSVSSKILAAYLREKKGK